MEGRAVGHTAQARDGRSGQVRRRDPPLREGDFGPGLVVGWVVGQGGCDYKPGF